MKNSGHSKKEHKIERREFIVVRVVVLSVEEGYAGYIRSASLIAFRGRSLSWID